MTAPTIPLNAEVIDITEADFALCYADDDYPFFEDEDGGRVYAYGHTDPTALAAAICAWSVECGATEPGDDDPADVTKQLKQRWGIGYVPNAQNPDEWRFTWDGVTATTPHAFPFTMLDR
ncbi:hypothetical protein [Curtobacterium oceanosedimentum]|uniref:hypothetical protein n=1 Tax=Curtobacterium oceanosedimentum TaxID=465820 RepID=UPI003393C5C9